MATQTLDPVISLVSPVYNGAAIVEAFVAEACKALETVSSNYELVLVDDASQDQSWNLLQQFARNNPRIVAVRLSRNYGQHRAILAGLAVSRGDAIAVIDCDLQEDPGALVRMWEEHQKGFDVVMTRRMNRDDPFLKRLSSKAFHYVFNRLVNDPDLRGGESLGNFCLISRRIVDVIVSTSERDSRFLPMVLSVGFPRSYVDIPHFSRAAGQSSYRVGKLISHAMDAVSSYSTKLLYFSAILGLALSLLAILSAAGLVVARIALEFQSGWASTIVTVLFMSGLIIMSQGVVGIYVGKILEQVKGRPLFIISETENCGFSGGVGIGGEFKTTGPIDADETARMDDGESGAHRDFRDAARRRAG